MQSTRAQPRVRLMSNENCRHFAILDSDDCSSVRWTNAPVPQRKLTCSGAWLSHNRRQLIHLKRLTLKKLTSRRSNGVLQYVQQQNRQVGCWLFSVEQATDGLLLRSFNERAALPVTDSTDRSTTAIGHARRRPFESTEQISAVTLKPLMLLLLLLLLLMMMIARQPSQFSTVSFAVCACLFSLATLCVWWLPESYHECYCLADTFRFQYNDINNIITVTISVSANSRDRINITNYAWLPTPLCFADALSFYMARFLKGSHSFTCTPRVQPLTEWIIPAFAFPAEAGTHLLIPEGWKTELALGDWLVTYRNKCPTLGIEPGHGDPSQ